MRDRRLDASHVQADKLLLFDIASLAALRGSGAITYSAAKSAVRSVGKTLAKKLGSKGIRVKI